MWKHFNSKIRKLEKDNAELRKELIELYRLINEQNENSLVNNDDSKTLLTSDNPKTDKIIYSKKTTISFKKCNCSKFFDFFSKNFL